MIARARSASTQLAALLLAATLLSGCYRAVEVERPRADQRIASLVLSSGDSIDFASAERALLEDTAVVVRRGNGDIVLRTIPVRDIERMYVEEYDGRRTTRGFLGVVGAVTLFMLVTVLSSDYFTCGC